MVSYKENDEEVRNKKKLFKIKKDDISSKLVKLREEDWNSILKNSSNPLDAYIESIQKRILELESPDEIHLLNGIESRLEYILIALDKYKNINSERDESIKKIISEYPLKIESDIYACLTFLEQYESTKVALGGLIQEPLKNIITKVDEELNDFRRLRNLSNNAKTEDIYHNAVIKYKKLEDDYRKYFYWAICITVIVSLGTFCVKKLLVPDLLGNIEFWVVKVSILAVGITLITFFLKQSSHYQRLADQNYQTQVELQAYPNFMESIPTEEAASVRKELALKYFGREIDGAAHKDMSNLISDQMKSTTEMVKAATDALKVKG